MYTPNCFTAVGVFHNKKDAVKKPRLSDISLILFSRTRTVEE